MTNKEIYRYAFILMCDEQKKLMNELTNKWIDTKSIRIDIMNKIIDLNKDIDEIKYKIEKEKEK